jgi:hypothetical protein
VECFIRREAFAKPVFTPGAYVAFNCSLNKNTTASGDQWQWAASKSVLTWDNPDTWGDLLLLGSDAKLRFTAPFDPEEDLGQIVPGMAIGLEILDKDMNLSHHRIDRISAEVFMKDSPHSVFVVLGETDVASGLFRGSLNTQEYFLPARQHTLNVRSGATVTLSYTDMRTAYGEQEFEWTEDLQMGYAGLQMDSKKR